MIRDEPGAQYFACLKGLDGGETGGWLTSDRVLPKLISKSPINSYILSTQRRALGFCHAFFNMSGGSRPDAGEEAPPGSGSHSRRREATPAARAGPPSVHLHRCPECLNGGSAGPLLIRYRPDLSDRSAWAERVTSSAL